MEKEIAITYETLFELLRREKTREELQKIDIEFYQDVVNYLQEKLRLLEAQKNKTDLFAVEERMKAEKQMQNIKRIIKELYERREKKIISMATDTSRTFSTIVDTSAMLAKEKQFFDALVETLNRFRKGILWNMLEAQMPNIEEKQEEKEPEPAELFKQSVKQPEKKEIKLVRFTHAVPKFVGENLEEFGPFETEDIANLPTKIADILVTKGRAEEIANK
jgi:DNA replication initiation complex subunit (GINS family)